MVVEVYNLATGQCEWTFGGVCYAHSSDEKLTCHHAVAATQSHGTFIVLAFGGSSDVAVLHNSSDNGDWSLVDMDETARMELPLPMVGGHEVSAVQVGVLLMKGDEYAGGDVDEQPPSGRVRVMIATDTRRMVQWDMLVWTADASPVEF